MDKKMINDVAKMAKEAAEVTCDLLKENKGLRAALATANAKLTERNKQAADSAETAVVGLSDDAIERVVDHIIGAGQAKEASRDELLKTFAKQPDKLVDYVEKLASTATSQPVKRLGKIASDASKQTSVKPSEAYWQSKVIRR